MIGIVVPAHNVPAHNEEESMDHGLDRVGAGVCGSAPPRLQGLAPTVA